MQIPVETINQLAKRFRCESDSEYFAGGHDYSDGVVYRYQRNSLDYLLKIVSVPVNDTFCVHRTEERFRFLDYLTHSGVSTIHPIHSIEGNLVESVLSHDSIYVAFSWLMIKGDSIAVSHPKDRGEFYQMWGRELGKMHQAAMRYPDWEKSPVLDHESQPIISWEAEWRHFYHWLQDPEIKEAWQEMHGILAQYPQSRENFGFIHNDPHPGNILLKENQLYFIDFDVANYHWFMLDIAICVFSEYARIEHHSPHKDLLPQMEELFVIPFMHGYESVNVLPVHDYHNIEIFLRYRRFVMFAVFYEQIKANAPDYLQVMKKELIESKPFLKGVSLFTSKY